MTRDQINLLLYLETRAVDHSGRVDMARMNKADIEQADKWDEEGFIHFGRIVRSDCTANGSYWVTLSPLAWSIAHKERQVRAERGWKQKMFQTTKEKREVIQ